MSRSSRLIVYRFILKAILIDFRIFDYSLFDCTKWPMLNPFGIFLNEINGSMLPTKRDLY